ncbi:hypothetical protein [Streptomyces sp. NPDC057429]|uniref:hypothetical protein n=1 Tax=Streptomyces sp. NPDC057429 TaxID=3346130 RepID=UPI003692946C
MFRHASGVSFVTVDDAVAVRLTLGVAGAGFSHVATLSGALVRGGDAPQRAAEHIVESRRRGALRPLPG